MPEDPGLAFRGITNMIEFVLWVLQNIAMVALLPVRRDHQSRRLARLEQSRAVMRFIYYGASVEFFFVVFTTFLILTALGMAWKREILWTAVRILEAVANAVGRTAAWAGLVMVLIQVMIVFLQRIFRVAAIELGPFGTAVAFDLSWWAEGLKFWNAIVVTLCVAYTFVQGSHVRVDLVYSAVKFRTKKGDRHVRRAVFS